MLIAKGCLSWVLPPILGDLLFLYLTWTYGLAYLTGLIPLLAVTVFFLIFFRDPTRIIGPGIVSPADGRIRDIKVTDQETFISVFMEVNNVHVNRMPLDGTVKKMVHFPGTHLRAWKKESDLNERITIDLETPLGPVKLVQLAGLIARRVYPYIKDGDVLKKGDKIGIIRLGSRVDVHLPTDKIKQVTVKVGDPVLAGITTIAEPKENTRV
jgi:phosphatidylserine decarboxylase